MESVQGGGKKVKFEKGKQMFIKSTSSFAGFAYLPYMYVYVEFCFLFFLKHRVKFS